MLHTADCIGLGWGGREVLEKIPVKNHDLGDKIREVEGKAGVVLGMSVEPTGYILTVRWDEQMELRQQNQKPK
jgi:hypothetical protein